MNLAPLQLCLLFSSALFCVGLIGALARSNTILVLLGVELMLNAANINFIAFGSPYLLHHLPELPAYILTYDTHPGAEMAAVKALAGEIPVVGKLPISLPGLYPVGHGLKR